MDRPRLPDGARMARIEEILKVLQYEIVMGLADGDVPETMTFQFFGPPSKEKPDATMFGRFVLKPTYYYMEINGHEHD